MTLTGQLTGNNRAHIEQQAQKIAARYYNTECVTVTLTDEEADTTQIETTTMDSHPTYDSGETTFTANWQATIAHHRSTSAIGSSRCTRCGTVLPPLT